MLVGLIALRELEGCGVMAQLLTLVLSSSSTSWFVFCLHCVELSGHFRYSNVIDFV